MLTHPSRPTEAQLVLACLDLFETITEPHQRQSNTQDQFKGQTEDLGQSQGQGQKQGQQAATQPARELILLAIT